MVTPLYIDITCNYNLIRHNSFSSSSACHETEITIEPDSIAPEEKLNVGVVGSGPAGMAFAHTAATIGHHVTLFDKSDEIGGEST